MLKSLSSIMLVSGLAFMGTAPFVADYIVLAVGIFGLGLAIVSRDGVLKSLPTRMLLLAVLLVGVTIPFVYQSELDLLVLAVFAAFLLAPGVAALLQRSPEWVAPQAFALVCLTGAVTASMVGLAEGAGIAGARVGAGNNPIHYGGIATMLGYMALTGSVSGRSPIRLLFLLGPLAGLTAALLSGSRGPLLAWFAIGAIAVPFLLWWNRRDWLALVGMGLVLAAAAAMASLASGNRAVEFFNAAGLSQVETSLASGTPPESAGLPELVAQAPVVQAIQQQDGARLALLDAAWVAFKSSPIVGVGYGQIMPLVQELHPEAGLEGLENYHNDIADFAAIAGIFGLLAYGLVILAPLVLLRSAAARNNQPLVLGSVMLVVGYGTLGLTNAMFGVLPQTMLFVLLLGYLMALQRGATQPE